MKNKQLIILAILLFSLTFVSTVIVKSEWNVIKFDGIEKDLYKIEKLKNNEICLSMINKDLSDIVKEKNKIEYPKSINVYGGKELKLKESRTLKAKSKFSLSKNKECFDLDKSVGQYQFGEHSLIIKLTNSYQIYPEYANYDFGMNSSSGMFINNDGLCYKNSSGGYLNIYDRDEDLIRKFGFGITSDQANSSTADYSWNWIWNDITNSWVADVSNPNFDWKLNYSFYQNENLKIEHYVNNKWKNLTNTKYWYIFTIEDSDNFRYNGQTFYGSIDTHLIEENISQTSGTIEFSAYETFDFSDTFSEYDVSDFYIGNATMFNKPNVRILGIAITKGGGNFSLGKNVTIDPTITLDLSRHYNSTDINVTQDDSFAHLNISDPNLVAYYPFDYPQENATWVAGNWSGALEFDGVDDYVSMGDVLDMRTNDWSVSAWIKTEDGSAVRGITGKLTGSSNDRRYGLYHSTGASGKLRGIATFSNEVNSIISSTTDIDDGVWHHGVVTYDRDGYMRLYVDSSEEGVAINISSYSAVDMDCGSDFIIGNFPSVSKWNGSIDEVMIFNRSLNSTEITELYTNNNVLNESALVGEWHLNDGTGFNAIDSSGEDNYGELIGFNSSERVAYDYTNNSNDGSSIGGVSPALNGYLGGAMSFDGVDDYVSTTANLNGVSEFTIASWVNMSSLALTSDRVMVGGLLHYLKVSSVGGGDYQSEVPTDTAIFYPMIGVGVALQDEWQFIALIYNGTHAWHNVNGVAQTKVLANGTIEQSDDFDFAKRSTAYTPMTLDETMIFNRALSESEVAQIYNSTYERFYPTGEMLFENLNFGSNNSVNITLDNCQTLNGSYLQGKINSGSWKNFSSCSFTDYSFTPTGSDNFSVKFLSTPYNFYSPLLIENISLDDWQTDSNAPNITINSPLNQSYGTNSILFNVTSTDITSGVDSCWYSIDGGSTNQSLNKFSTTDFYNYTNSSISDGQYTAQFYCNDSLGNLNNTENVIFRVDTVYPTLNLILPENTTIYTPNNVLLNYTSNDSFRDTCWYNVTRDDGTTEISNTMLPNCTNTSFIVSVYDTFTINLNVNDTANNINSTSIVFTVEQASGTSPATGKTGGGDAGISGYNETLVCDYAEGFLINHKTINGTIYTESEVLNLTDEINLVISPDISMSLVKLYLEDFENECNRTLPEFFKPKSNYSLLKIKGKSENCSVNLNKTIELNLIFTIPYNLDWSFPIGNWDIGEQNCEQINKKRNWFRLEELNGIYLITGVRLYLIIFPAIIFLIFLVLKPIIKNKLRK